MIETTAVAPITWFDNTNACCQPEQLSVELVAECHAEFPFIRNLTTGNVTITPEITISESILGFKLNIYDITEIIKKQVSTNLNVLVSNTSFPIGPTVYNVTSLINTIIESNMMPGDLLDCPKPGVNGGRMGVRRRRALAARDSAAGMVSEAAAATPPLWGG
eukprot:g10869.t1